MTPSRQTAGVSPSDVRASHFHEPSVLGTYRSIRLAIVLLVVLLLAALVAQAVQDGCWQTSVSAYYWTPAHDVVVAMLCGVGVCLLVYQGSSPVEDALLDVAGVLAFVVAMVPTSREPSCGTVGTVGAGGALPLEQVATEGVRTNVLAVLVTAAAAQLVHVVLVRRGALTREPSRAASWVRAVGWVVVGTGAVVLVVAPDLLVTAGHDVAAPLFFVVVIGAVMVSAWQARQARERAVYARLFAGVAVAMVVTLLATALLRAVVVPDWEHAVLVVEALLVAEFAAFWVVQTVELWHVADRRELMDVAGPR